MIVATTELQVLILNMCYVDSEKVDLFCFNSGWDLVKAP
jgi:hypothetical protein